ncbi:hypothetical protein [Natrinema sp. DC36]|nr:hypothetical protein [Natrinema sp. DC36]
MSTAHFRENSFSLGVGLDDEDVATLDAIEGAAHLEPANAPWNR